jgi:uncharacterized protein (TIGR03067 family)
MMTCKRGVGVLAGMALLVMGAALRGEEKQAHAPKAADAEVAAELAKIKGSWRALRGELAGEPRKESFLLTFGDATVVKKGEKKTENAVFHLNPSVHPKQIDILKEEGKKRWLLGIYEIEGDTLKFCFGPERPQELATKPGQNALLLELRREAASEAPAPSDK